MSAGNLIPSNILNLWLVHIKNKQETYLLKYGIESFRTTMMIVIQRMIFQLKMSSDSPALLSTIAITRRFIGKDQALEPTGLAANNTTLQHLSTPHVSKSIICLILHLTVLSIWNKYLMSNAVLIHNFSQETSTVSIR